MSESSTSLPKNALVIDFLGRAYVPINPGYASPTRVYCRVLACRCVLAALSCATFILCVVGQIVSSVLTHNGKDSTKYTVWTAVDKGISGNLTLRRDDETEMQAVAALSAILGFVAMGLSIASAVLWAVLERRRAVEAVQCRRALQAYGERRSEEEQAAAAASAASLADRFPYTNPRVENRGQVSRVPCEEAEQRRCTVDKNVTISALVVHTLTGIFAVTTLGLMISDYEQLQWDSGQNNVRIGAAVPVFAVATGLALLTIVLVSVPQVTQSRLCGRVSPPRCALMVVSEADAGSAGEELRRLMLAANPLMSGVMTGVPVALPGPSVDSADANPRHSYPQPYLSAQPHLLQGRCSTSLFPPPSSVQQQQQQPQHTSNASSPTQKAVAEVGAPFQHAYGSADYYEAPPQLFQVHKDPLEAGVVDGEASVPVTPCVPEVSAPPDTPSATTAASRRTHAAASGFDGAREMQEVPREEQPGTKTTNSDRGVEEGDETLAKHGKLS